MLKYINHLIVTVVLLSACDSRHSVESSNRSGGISEDASPALPLKKISTSEPSKGDPTMLRSIFNECIKASGGVTPEMQDCIETEFDYQETRLNTAYRLTRDKLPENKRADFERAQEKWISERDAQCRFDAAEDGQAQRLEANDCFLEVTAKRASEIESMKD